VTAFLPSLPWLPGTHSLALSLPGAGGTLSGACGSRPGIAAGWSGI
jgi:hypothetical protein